jgi:hypothetical protein
MRQEFEMTEEDLQERKAAGEWTPEKDEEDSDCRWFLAKGDKVHVHGGRHQGHVVRYPSYGFALEAASQLNFMERNGAPLSNYFITRVPAT